MSDIFQLNNEMSPLWDYAIIPKLKNWSENANKVKSLRNKKEKSE